MPLGLKKIAGTNVTGDFSGFENENRGTKTRVLNMERDEIYERSIGRHHGEV